MWFFKNELTKDRAVLPLASLGTLKAYEPQRWICECSSFIYNPATMGGLAFEELGKKWKCPCCGAKKKAFRKTDQRSVS
ncbi:hypothetical protein [Terasakiella pusilla]|uniref:hypothetical protein n=1 Tax=Terasakiella pusilla TaxID=64973 RepID=UPI0005715A08|nr:hypothetical protein [Terasakiella pusilla]